MKQLLIVFAIIVAAVIIYTYKTNAQQRGPDNGIIEFAATGGSSDWVALDTFYNSWGNKDTVNYYPAQYKKFDDGLVVLVGYISSGTLAQTAVLLPAGARPGKQMTFFTSGDAGDGGKVIVNDISGAVIPVSPHSNAGVHLCGISFYAEK